MTKRIATLQVKYVNGAQLLPEDAPFTKLQPALETLQTSYWYKFWNKSPIVNLLPKPYCDISYALLKATIRQHLIDNLNTIRSNAKLLKCCRSKMSVNPIMWIPMSNKEISHCIRWRLGWLPGGRSKPCLRCTPQQFTKKYAIHCLPMHRRIQIYSQHEDPLSDLLN